jgi:hypothetical protein
MLKIASVVLMNQKDKASKITFQHELNQRVNPVAEKSEGKSNQPFGSLTNAAPLLASPTTTN